ncbi:MAG TPA: DUF4191 domain-containing protein [Dermatophilaceae bacterium]|nr:DUF4191 domain-containing protein [Dermatophilaceae bacterium]
MARQRPDDTAAKAPRRRFGSRAKPPAGDKKQGRLAQIKQVYTLTRQHDPLIGVWMVGMFVLVVLLGYLIGSRFDLPVYGAFVALPLAFLAATFLLSKRAERAMYRVFEAQPGGAGAALQGLRRGWSYEQQPVAIDAGRSTDMTEAGMLFRAVGRPGVVLIGEGPAGRVARLLQNERKRTQRLVPNVPVTTLRVGVGEGTDVVAHRQLLGKLKKLPKRLTKTEVSAVTKRLRSVGGARPSIPPGVDPAKARSMGRGMRK